MDFTILVLIIGIAIGFFVQTITGFGAALFALPILLLVFDLHTAMAYVSVFLFLFSIILVWKTWKDIDKKTVLEMSIGIIIGMIIGVYTLRYGNPVLLEKLLGIFIVVYVLYRFVEKKQITVFKKLGLLFGLLGGFFSGLFASGGSFIVTYLSNKITKVRILRATTIGALFISNTMRVPLLMYHGILNSSILSNSLIVIPFFLISLYFGNYFFTKINNVLFRKIIFVLLFIIGLHLILK